MSITDSQQQQKTPQKRLFFATNLILCHQPHALRWLSGCGGKPADVYFLLDSSSSIWHPEFQDQLHFLTQLLPLFDLGPDSTRVGVAVFSDRVHNIVSLTDHQSSHSIKKALQRAPYLTGT